MTDESRTIVWLLGLLLCSNQENRQSWDYIGNRLDKEGGLAFHLWISWSVLLCSSLSFYLLNLKSTQMPHSSGHTKLQPISMCFVATWWLRFTLFSCKQEINPLNPENESMICNHGLYCMCFQCYPFKKRLISAVNAPRQETASSTNLYTLLMGFPSFNMWGLNL